MVPVPSMWPETMWPPKRPSAAMARSRFTRLPAAQGPQGGAVQGLVHDVGGEAVGQSGWWR